MRFGFETDTLTQGFKENIEMYVKRGMHASKIRYELSLNNFNRVGYIFDVLGIDRASTFKERLALYQLLKDKTNE